MRFTSRRTALALPALATCLLVLAAAASLVIGCQKEDTAGTAGQGSKDAGSNATGDQTIRILWAEWDPAKALQQLGDDYQKQTGTPVSVVQKSWAGDFLNTALNEFRNEGTTYDIIIGDSQWLGMGVAGGHYVELTDWVPQNIDVSTIAPAAWKWYCEYPKGSKRLYAVPCEADAMAWCYRKDLFEDPKHKDGFKAYLKEKNVSGDLSLEPPKTWEHLRLIAAYFKDKAGIAGLVMPTARDYDMATQSFQQVMWAFGGEYGDYATHQVKVNRPETVEALRFFTELMKTTSNLGTNMTFAEVGPTYMTGKAAMACNFMAFFPGIASDKVNPDFAAKTGYFNMPAGPKGRFATLGGQGMSVNAHASPERQQRAKDFLKWFNTTDVQYKWAELGGFTNNVEVMRSERFKGAAAYNPLFEEAFGMMNDFWSVPEFDEMMKVCQREFCAVFQDGKDPQQAVETIQKQHEDILRQGGHLKTPVAVK